MNWLWIFFLLYIWFSISIQADDPFNLLFWSLFYRGFIINYSSSLSSRLLFIVLLLITYIHICGLLLTSAWLLFFISSMSGFILFLSVIDSISIILQSLTLTNRLSINIIAGGLLVNILFLCLDLRRIVDYWVWIDYWSFIFLFILALIFDFEILSFLNQSFIFIILLLVIIH